MSTQAYAGTMTTGSVVEQVAKETRAATHEAVQTKVTAPGATASVVCGVCGLILFGLILGGVAISKAAAAKKLIEDHPDQYDGGGLASVGMVLGVLDIIGAVVALFVILAK